MPGQAVFRVVDAFDAPHGGRILRLRLQSGDAPAVKSLNGARLHAMSPGGDERYARVDGFAVFGGRVSDDDLRRTGRIDVVVVDESDVDQPPIGARWDVTAS